MSKRCQITGKSVQSGHKVSHSNIKTKRKFEPNLQTIELVSDILGRSFRLRVSVSGIRTVDHNGGLDQFLLTAKSNNLTPEALKIKRAIRKAINAEKKANLAA